MRGNIVVGKDRIKTLTACGSLAGDEHARARIEQQIAEQMGAELARKLMEFGKVSTHDVNGQTVFMVSLDIIVPKKPPN